jgi:CD109 antigen
VAPESIRPGQPYTVSATILNSTGNVQLNVSLQIGNSTVQSLTTLASGSTGSVILQVPATLTVSTITLTAFGSGGLSFLESWTVGVAAKTVSIFVQTDKAVYNPRETVLFRVLTVKQDLKPFTDNVSVIIRDPYSNVIAQWLGKISSLGLFNSSIVLSDLPTTGAWTITATAQSYSYSKVFTVTNYKPAAIQMNTGLPPVYYVNLQQITQQQNLPITVDVKSLASGLTVVGNVRVNISLRYYYEWTDYYLNNYKTMGGQNEIILNLQLSGGQASATIVSTQLRDITPVPVSYLGNVSYAWGALASRSMTILITVNDTVTNELVTTNTTVPCLQWNPSYDYSLRFVDDSAKIVKPGIPVALSLQLKRNDGSALSSADFSSNAVTFTGNCLNGSSSAISFSYSGVMPLSGLLPFNQPSQCAQINSVTAHMTVGGTAGTSVISASWNATRFTSRDDEALALTLVSPQNGIAAGSTVTFRAQTTNSVTSLTYQLIGRGSLVKSATLIFAASKSHDFLLTIDAQMASTLAPKARLLVWYSTQTGEIISESLDFNVNLAFANQVSASLSAASVQPGEAVTVSVSSAAGSFVGLLAVDQTALLAPGYDVTQQTILQDLFLYQTVNTCPNFAGTQSGGNSASAVFKMAGVIAISDGYIYPYYSCSSSTTPVPVPNYSTLLKSYLDTWLWTDLTLGSTGKGTLQAKTPDKTATWMLTAFSISPSSGLAVTALPINLTASRQLFVTLKAPYSVVRGEEFGLLATAFNYLDYPTVAMLTLQKSENFSVRTPSNKNPLSLPVALNITLLPARGSASVNFWIVPQKLGIITLYVTGVSATGQSYAASVQVLIVAEGIPQQYSESVLANPPLGSSAFDHVFSVTIPPSAIAGSVQINVTAVGDVMGPTLDGLANLIQMPCGCGEQTMIGLAPNIYVLNYLRAVGKSTPAIESTALMYISAGYQRELTFQRRDGSLSAFGDWDPSGSVWLTSFVAKCFHEAKAFIPLDERKIAVMLNWILKYQKGDGSFDEPGIIYHWDIQGEASGGEPLAAYVLISLLENNDNSLIEAINGTDIQTPIALTRAYLESRLNNISSNPYALSITCYALQLSNSTQVDTCLRLLSALATNDTKNGQLYWTKYSAKCMTYFWGYWCTPPLAVDVEMTGYALLTYVRRKQIAPAGPISKWIISQRNPWGGFRSTQDTVVALQALAEYAELASGGGSSQSLSISVTAAPSFSHSFTITTSNALTVQLVEVPPSATTVAIRATGGGVFGIVQMTVKYNMKSTDNAPSRRRRAAPQTDSEVVSVRTNQLPLSDNQILLQACANYTSSNARRSGMCIMEIAMPSGYAAVDASSLRGQDGGNVKKVEVDDSTNGLVLYLDELKAVETCVNTTLTKLLAVSNGQPSKVSAYLYYSPDVKAVQEFVSASDSGSTWCDQCPSCCQCTAPNYFTCDSTQCMPIANRCDGVRQCTDGYDETGCSSGCQHYVTLSTTAVLTGASFTLLTLHVL